ncbi:MAG: hypothetical protein HN778_13080 [Prolixibacteraceae bacterium]|jgi:hypothetical protein|nr:hypothetical protein [Prolixibacteraceae bacterium]MBT6006809.1 hypothetical protein [Prolixibacteraceae bacterium]MBT6766926.1 hypothetical protein [Prolixibacteraceae bacterium]MBT7395761.1 hypothetical protein [Prolixibacteraceae bacterium]
MTNRDIEKYINDLQKNEADFKNQSIPVSENPGKRKSNINLWRRILLLRFFILSAFDFIHLYFYVRFRKKILRDKKIVYTAKNFCTLVDGKLEDRVVKPIFTKNILFINQSKEFYINKINNQKVFNLGGTVKLLSSFIRNESKLMRIFRAYSIVNNTIIKLLPYKQEIYMLWFYDLNSLSLVFSSHRDNISLIEVQHGSIINYPPYVKPAPVLIADVFYVKNHATIDYLKTHLCLNHNSRYKLIPYPKGNRKHVPGLHIFYASTIEFKGLHPVLKDFLANNKWPELHLTVRLHPREKEKEPIFKEQLDQYKINYEFDNSKNWLEGNFIENLIVVSPWSSTIEDSYDNGFITIVIDPVGKQRYNHLIDNKHCFYTNNLNTQIKELFKHY